MTYETIEIAHDARGVATLILARPDKHNALSALMINEVTAAAHALGQDASVRAVVLRAQGTSFCAGGDLGWMQDQMKADPVTRGREAKALALMLQALNTMPKPLIGVIHGNAFGGGVGMASVCDVAIGLPEIKLGLTEVRLGLIPATIGPYVVARIGVTHARRVFMSGQLFDAETAKEIGILTDIVEESALDAQIEATIKPFLSVAPAAAGRAKALALSLGGSITEATIDHTIKELVTCWESEEAQEGISAFFEKRRPNWKA